MDDCLPAASAAVVVAAAVVTIAAQCTAVYIAPHNVHISTG